MSEHICAKHCAPSDRGGKANARRDRIVQAARELFSENGFHATGIARISERSGVLVGQIYRDFANKEAIVAALVQRDLDIFLFTDEFRRARVTRDHDLARAWIARFISGEDIPDMRLVSEILAEATRNPRVADIFRAVDERLREQLIEALQIIVPGDAPAHKVRCLADAIMIFSGGMCQGRMVLAENPAPEVLMLLMQMIDREVALISHGDGTC